MTDPWIEDYIAKVPKRTWPHVRMDYLMAPADRHPTALAFTIPMETEPEVPATLTYAGHPYRVTTHAWHPYGNAYPVIGSDGVVYAGELYVAIEAIP